MQTLMKTVAYIGLLIIVEAICSASVSLQTDGSITSDGAMEGVNLQRNGLYRTRGVHQLNTVLWKSDVLCRPARHNTYSQPIIVGEILFFVCDETSSRIGYDFFSEDYVYAIDIKTGYVKWKFERKQSGFSALAVAGGVVYFGSLNGSFDREGGVFFALDAGTGKEKWSYSIKRNPLASASPAVIDGSVYFRDMDGNFYSLNSQTGRLNWSFNAKGELTLAAFLNDSVYFGNKNYFYGLDAKTGERKWEYDAGSVVGDPFISDGVLYFGIKDGRIVGLNPVDGKEFVKFKPAQKIGTFFAAAENTIYYGGVNKDFYAIDARTGLERWTFKTGKACMNPVIADGTVYFGCYDRNLYGANAKTGQQEWKAESKEIVSYTPTIVDGTMFFVRDDGRIYAAR